MPPSPRHAVLLHGAAAALSGLAVALAFPPYDLVILLPVGLAALMWLVRDVSGGRGFWLGLFFGLGFMLPLMRWITVIGLDAWVALGLLEASFYGLMGVSWAWLRGQRWWPVGVAATWVTAETLRGTVPFGGLPWGSLAFGLVDTPVVRLGRWGGTALVSFAVVLAVAAVVQAVEDRRRPSLAGAVAAVTLLALTVAIPVGTAGPGDRVSVAAIQGNVPGEGMDPFSERRAVLHNHADTTIELARQVEAGERPRPDVVIWPENASDIDPYTDAAAYQEIDDAVRVIGVPTLVGAVVNGPDSQHVQNMGVVWSPATGAGEQYIKRHPVPFGEYIPFRRVLTRFIDRLQQIPRDFAQGTKNGVLDLGPVRVGDVICFEVAYDGLVRDAIGDGGQLLVVQTNNATYAGTGQLEQQFAISRYRAIETGRSVVVAATNGISGIVTPNGEVVDQSEQRTRDVIQEEVTLGSGLTLGVRVGFWVELALAVAGAVLTAWARLGPRVRLGRIVA